MTRAGKRLSTPPTNTPIDTHRRHFLAITAAASAVAAGSLALAAATPVSDTALTELVAKFERLLGEYYARRSDWAPRLEQAHAETNAIFGQEYGSEDRARFFSEACARLDVGGAGDRMHVVGEEMKPLARVIVALPTNSLEALRAKALVAFWEVAPLGADDTEYYFEDGFPFQLLFSAVAEFCDLTHKVTATGYTLPELPDLFSPYDDDDEEEA